MPPLFNSWEPESSNQLVYAAAFMLDYSLTRLFGAQLFSLSPYRLTPTSLKHSCEAFLLPVLKINPVPMASA